MTKISLKIVFKLPGQLVKFFSSNFKIVGFTSSPDRRDLAKLAKDQNVILMEDLGSGVLIDLSPYGLVDEPVVGDILKNFWIV